MITFERANSLLRYCPDSGKIFWKKSRKGVAAKSNLEAGSITERGYRRICIDGQRIMAHRIAFLLMRGTMPDCDVDHINHKRDDNRWSNLRLVNRSGNMRNATKPKANRSGVCGVSWDAANNKWRASIADGGKAINLGRYANKHEAVEARKSAERALNYHENHGA